MPQGQSQRPKVRQWGRDQEEICHDADGSVCIQEISKLETVAVHNGIVPRCLDRPTLEDGGENGADADAGDQPSRREQESTEAGIREDAQVRGDDGQLGEGGGDCVEDVCDEHELSLGSACGDGQGLAWYPYRFLLTN